MGADLSKSLLDTIKELSQKSVVVGIQGTKGEQKKIKRRVSYKQAEGDTKEEKKRNFKQMSKVSSVTVAQVAGYNEFGTKTKSGARGIPSRPFIRGTLKDNKKTIATAASRILFHDTNSFHDKMGLFLVSLVRKKIRDGISPENSLKTVRQKGSSTPLIDTGQLIGSLTYEVVDK